MILGSSLLSLMMGCFDERYNFLFSISRTIVFFQFFLLGYVTKDARLDVLTRYRMLSAIILILIFLFVYQLPHKYPIMFGCHSYERLGYTMCEGILLRLALSIISIIMSVSVISLFRGCCTFSKYGQRSLFFYVYHLMIIQIVFTGAENGLLPKTFVHMLLYTLCTIIILMALSNFQIAFNILIPSKYLYKICKKSQS